MKIKFVGIQLLLHAIATNAYYHVLVAEEPAEKVELNKNTLKSHFRRRRSITSPSDIMLSMMSDEGSGTDGGSGAGEDVLDPEIERFEFFMKNNDTVNTAKSTLGEMMPGNAVLLDFLIHNNGKTYSFDKSSARSFEQASKIYEESTEKGLSVVMIGDVKSVSDRCTDCRTDAADEQSVSAAISVAPGDLLSISVTYLIPIESRELDTGKKLYRNDVTISLQESAEKVMGVLMSPNYPDNYPNEADLTWLITAPKFDMVLTAILISFQTEECCDHLYIYDGDTDAAPVLYVVSGNNFIPEKIVTTRPSMLVKFQTDFALTDGGFALQFESASRNGVIENGRDEDKLPTNNTVLLSGSEGIIETDHYPLWYTAASTFEWDIVVADDLTIDIRIIDFDIFPGEILTISDLNSGEIVNTFDYSLTPPYDLNVSSNSVSIQFNSHDYILPKRGLYATFRTRTTDKITLPQGDLQWHTLYSPRYPNNYLNNEYQAWQISTADDTAVIRIEIKSLDLENGFDFLHIYDGSDIASDRKVATLSGRDTADIELRTYSNTATIILQTDGSVTGKGFDLRYRSYKYYENCTTSVQYIDGSVSGTIRNPSYGNYDYMNTNCQWLISVDQGKVIGISLDWFEAGYASLTFYDGDSNVDDKILWSSYSNSYVYDDAINFVSTSNQVLATITRTRAYNTRYSFDIHEENENVVQTCQSTQVFTAAPGQIKSQLYPNYSPTGMDCSWLIQAPFGYQITATVDTSYSNSYSYNSFKFYDGNSTDSLIYNCGSCSGHTVKSVSDEMLIVSHIGSLFYFKLDYEFRAGSVTYVNQDIGLVESPSYPSYYADNSYEVVHVSVSSGVILFKFEMFETESCCDYLYLYDGSYTSSPQIAALSGSHPGFQSVTTGSDLTLEFRSNGDGRAPGYLMYYCDSYQDCSFVNATHTTYSVQTNDKLNTYEYIYSPSFFGLYPNNVDFYWYIECTSKSFYRKYFSVSRVDVDDSDHLKIYNNFEIDDSMLIKTYSGNTRYQTTYTFTTYYALNVLWFHADDAFSGMGFVVGYYCQS